MLDRATDPAGDALGGPAVEHRQLLVAGRFLQPGEVAAVQVLGQHVGDLLGCLARVLVADVARHRGQAGGDRCGAAAMPEQQQVAAVIGRGDDQRLQDADGADAVGQLGQLGQVAQVGAGVVWVVQQAAGVQFQQHPTGHGEAGLRLGLRRGRIRLRFGVWAAGSGGVVDDGHESSF